MFHHIKGWLNLNAHWLRQDICLYVMAYQDLISNLKDELLRLAVFLNIPKDKLSEEHIDCVIAHSEGNFKRPPHVPPPGIYTARMNETIDRAIRQLGVLLRKRNKTIMV